jgi:PAS domain-containing protein
VKLVANPVILRAAVVLFCAGFAFLLGLIFIRLLRKSIDDEADLSAGPSPSPETLPLHLFNTVIQQLKQQKHESEVQSKAEQHRARISETFSQAVLSNLSSGVLVFGSNGLVKASNPAANEILGFASATGMGAEDLFRGAVVLGNSHGNAHESSGESADESTPLADEVDSVLNLGSKRRHVLAEYETPAGATRFLAVTISPVAANDGGLLGAACLIHDLTELETIRRHQELRAELSAERALELRSSLATITGYSQQLASNRNPEIARQLAADVAEESARLERSLGGFLTEGRAVQGGTSTHPRTAAPGAPAEQSSAAAPASSAR